eukprot:2588084-Pyramimonas_sp.AAC.2
MVQALCRRAHHDRMGIHKQRAHVGQDSGGSEMADGGAKDVAVGRAGDKERGSYIHRTQMGRWDRTYGSLTSGSSGRDPSDEGETATERRDNKMAV